LLWICRLAVALVALLWRISPAPAAAATPSRRARVDARRERGAALLEDADRLAAEGRFDEATHLLLSAASGRSPPRGPTCSSRRPPRARSPRCRRCPTRRARVRVIAGRVERSLFALRSLSADDWHAARAAYADFALAAPPAPGRHEPRRSPFSPRTMLALLVVGAGAMLLFLYAVGAGWDGPGDRNGGSHAAANGLNGFAGLVRLLKAEGHDVALSRTEARLKDEALVVLTPQLRSDGERIGQIIEERRYRGPTLVILPKWFAMDASLLRQANVPQGWVVLGGATAPEWLGEIEAIKGAKAQIGERRSWKGMELSGSLPAPHSG
jgi:hypothetical protein